MKKPSPTASVNPAAISPIKKRRRRRPRIGGRTPAWLMERADLDELAKRRCLLVLSVLSGERTVMDAVGEAQISATTYQQYETKALEAMIAALTPDGEGVASPRQRIEELEKKVTQLEQAKRRSERLLILTRQVVRPGPVTTGMGRKPKTKSKRASQSSKASGKGRSPRSTKTKTTTGSNGQPADTQPASSTLSRTGAAEP